uniref:Uncharacterized protein n=1 Tax=Picocystis salinarum TaxID=88271 RepID=A0A6U9PIR8_9CHLO
MAESSARAEVAGCEEGCEGGQDNVETEGEEESGGFYTPNAGTEGEGEDNGSGDEIDVTSCSSLSFHEESSSGDETNRRCVSSAKSGHRTSFIPRLSAFFDCLSSSKPRSSRVITPPDKHKCCALSKAESTESSRTPDERRRRSMDASQSGGYRPETGRILRRLDSNSQCILVQPSPHVEKRFPVQQAVDPIQTIPTCSKDVVLNLLASKRLNRLGSGHHCGTRRTQQPTADANTEDDESKPIDLSKRMDEMTLV